MLANYSSYPTSIYRTDHNSLLQTGRKEDVYKKAPFIVFALHLTTLDLLRTTKSANFALTRDVTNQRNKEAMETEEAMERRRIYLDDDAAAADALYECHSQTRVRVAA